MALGVLFEPGQPSSEPFRGACAKPTLTCFWIQVDSPQLPMGQTPGKRGAATFAPLRAIG